jgi:Asp-tRNA(Asn)/Glu-tRNA(Gln) amidotransferase A subunit family amidase
MRPAPRAAADESSACWKAGRPLSAIDGMPIGIKDLLETKDMPTQMGCEAFRGNFPKSDNVAVWALREAGAVILARPPRPNLADPIHRRQPIPSTPARTAGGSSLDY